MRWVRRHNMTVAVCIERIYSWAPLVLCKGGSFFVLIFTSCHCVGSFIAYDSVNSSITLLFYRLNLSPVDRSVALRMQAVSIMSNVPVCMMFKRVFSPIASWSFDVLYRLDIVFYSNTAQKTQHTQPKMSSHAHGYFTILYFF